MNLHLCSQKNVVFCSPKFDGMCQNLRIYWRYRHDVENTTKHYKTLQNPVFMRICGLESLYTLYIAMSDYYAIIET